MTKQSQHTPGPWKVIHGMDGDVSLIRANTKEGGVTVATCSGWGKEWAKEERGNAAFIVKACNNYDDLLESLRGMVNLQFSLTAPHPESRAAQQIEKAKAAISKAEGK